MSNFITIEKRSNDDLTLWTWRFWFYNRTLWLDFYSTAERPSRRHSFRHSEIYNRLDLRSSTIAEADVTLPAVVADEALQKVRESLTVKRWSEYKG